jgi:UDP-3-O-[3-hydroxymyristoyl] glucosamine N-acyltransferase
MERILDSIKLSELASKLEGELTGDNIEIYGIASIDDAKKGDITWVENKRAFEHSIDKSMSAIIISGKLLDEIKGELRVPAISVSNPKFAFAKALNLFYKRRVPPRTIAKTAIIAKNVKIGKDIHIGDYSVIADNTVIGDNTTIYPHVYLGEHVSIGNNSTIYPFVSIYDGSIIGNNVIIHSGAVIGADGFGFVEVSGNQQKVPQVGIVQLDDNVEIGANVTIDRATMGTTHIGKGSKIDNLVQIGHNCKLGQNCIMVSQSGIAGSCILGDNVTLAAQAGLAPHITIGSNTLIGGRGGVTHDIPGNSIVSGFPAKPHKEALKIRAAVGRLPNTMKLIKDMEKRMEKLEDMVRDLSKSNE